jgi:hypothetical protein
MDTELQPFLHHLATFLLVNPAFFSLSLFFAGEISLFRSLHFLQFLSLVNDTSNMKLKTGFDGTIKPGMIRFAQRMDGN